MAFPVTALTVTNQAREEIGRAASRKADDDAHRPRRIGLRPCHPRDGWRHGRTLPVAENSDGEVSC